MWYSLLEAFSENDQSQDPAVTWNSKMAKILVVEDEKATSEAIVDLLSFDKHTVETSFDGADARERLQSFQYDLIILDWTLPEMNGLQVLSEFRSRGGITPVLFLTGKQSIDNKTEGLDSGADDYLSKPFDVRELRSRVRALLRRPAVPVSEVLEAAELKLDLRAFKCQRNGVEIKLLPKEFELLKFFIQNKSVVFNIDELLERLWSCESDAGTDAVRQTVKRLRDKIDVDGKKSYITTVFGVGYKMDLP